MPFKILKIIFRAYGHGTQLFPVATTKSPSLTYIGRPDNQVHMLTGCQLHISAFIVLALSHDRSVIHKIGQNKYDQKRVVTGGAPKFDTIW